MRRVSDRKECPLCGYSCYVYSLQDHVEDCMRKLDAAEAKRTARRRKRTEGREPLAPSSVNDTSALNSTTQVSLAAPQLTSSPSSAIATATTSNGATALASAPTKRKRGRPRKTAAVAEGVAPASSPKDTPPLPVPQTYHRRAKRKKLDPHKAPRGERFQNLKACPVFYPSPEEFADPLGYIRTIRRRAEKAGICKVVPPGRPFEWQGVGGTIDESVEPSSFVFHTKQQNIRGLARRGPEDLFQAQLCQFNRRPMHAPRVAGNVVVYYDLYRAVRVLGGFQQVNESGDGWTEVARRVLPPPPSEDAAAELRDIYARDLLRHEVEYVLVVEEALSNTELQEHRRETELMHSSSTMSCTQTTSSDAATSTPTHLQMQLESHQSPPSSPPSMECDEPRRVSSQAEEHFGSRSKHVGGSRMSAKVAKLRDQDSLLEDFGYIEGKYYNLKTFKMMANRFMRRFFSVESGTDIDVDPNEVELMFWNIVEEGLDDTFVHYGSDLDVTSHGSGFSSRCTSDWNLNKLPLSRHSLFRHLPSTVISGVTVPMMYVGMVFSSFSWHVEDNNLFSINYLHSGAPKNWYGVPSSFADRFEEVFRRTYPDLFSVTPDLLFHLITMLHPSVLMDSGVEVYGTLQQPGEFVITFPQAYHAGFNTGFNIAEAVNFALPEWLPFGAKSLPLYSHFRRSCVIGYDELLYRVVLSEEEPQCLFWAIRQLSLTVEREELSRRRLRADGVVRSTVDWPTKALLVDRLAWSGKCEEAKRLWTCKERQSVAKILSSF